MLSHLGLGTVQFGLDYGVSNRRGRPDDCEVAAILARAAEAGVGYIDTAPSYANAEALVGRYLSSGHSLRIVTKTPALAEATIEARHGQRVLDTLAASLDRLKVDAVYGLLVHQSGDLAKPGWQHLVGAMAEAQARGWASRIGASVYNSDQLELVESCFRPELVQLPLNVLDHRPIFSGTLARLNAAGAEIHARSVFLQGLLLMKPSELPDFFLPLRETIATLHRRWAERGLSALAGCLGFVFAQKDVDVVIVGVNSCNEFAQIEAALAQVANSSHDFRPDLRIDPLYLDPQRWPPAAH